MGQGVATLDGTILAVNPAMCELLGRDRPALVGHPFRELLHPDDVPAAATVARLLAGGPGREVVALRLVRGDGPP